jgi:hypothetical protein
MQFHSYKGWRRGNNVGKEKKQSTPIGHGVDPTFGLISSRFYVNPHISLLGTPCSKVSAQKSIHMRPQEFLLRSIKSLSK